MAFHVACPITCRRICYCDLGFPRKLQNWRGRDEFLGEVFRIEEFIKDPWLLKAEANATVQVKVPKVVVVAPLVPPPPPVAAVQRVVPVGVVSAGKDGVGGRAGAGPGEESGDGDEAALAVSAQTKRVALQKKAAADSMVAEDFARRFESGAIAGPVKDDAQEEQCLSNVKVMCRLCFGGENEGSERAGKMLPCKSCGKKYHRSCLKAWSRNRDLFHWSSWTCPSCRICEVCRRSGDPNKFMFCKRCDGAFHCYCQQPPHKNVSSGPYLCPKHTKCHSCGSNVPGNGLSVRWFLGYTCCDACGRLFVKGNYCPVCLKVYRDSESTPMVCCDVCQHWVHCQCDNISDAKYLQFQVDGNLQYACPTCRGECYQVNNLEEAVQELWRRKDEADKDLIANLRAAAGLPTQEEIFSISPFSDDEENAPVLMKNEYGRSLKLSLRGVIDKSFEKSKKYVKKSSDKKYGKKKGHLMSFDSAHEAHQSLERHGDASSFGYDDRNEQMLSSISGEPNGHFSPVAGSINEGVCSVNQAGVLKHKFIDEVTASHNNRAPKTVKIKSNRPEGGGLNNGDTGNKIPMSRTMKGPKLVIHIGSRNRNLTSSPKSDGSSYQKDGDMSTSNGGEYVDPAWKNEFMDRQENAAKLSDGKAAVAYQRKGSKLRGKDGNFIKIKKAGTEAPDMPLKASGAKFLDGSEAVSALQIHALGQKSTEGNTTGIKIKSELPASRANRLLSMAAAESRPGALADVSDNGSHTLVFNSQKESKPLLKLKFKNSISENQSVWAPLKEDERCSVKGQRSKRKRSSPSREKVSTKSEDAAASQVYEDKTMDEIMDANWILQKLGKDAMGKRVEIHQPSDNSWHRGIVTEVFKGTSIVSVALDNGKAKNLELGKQGIRFISQKQKRQ